MIDWINALIKKPPPRQPVIIFGRVKGGRKSQVMVAWRRDEWTLKDDRCKWYIPTEWEGVRNGPWGGTLIDISCVTKWMPLPKVSNVELTGAARLYRAASSGTKWSEVERRVGGDES